MRDEKSFQTRNETAGILGPKRPDIDPVDQYQRRPGGSPGPKAISRLSDAVWSDLSLADNSRFSWASNNNQTSSRVLRWDSGSLKASGPRKPGKIRGGK